MRNYSYRQIALTAILIAMAVVVADLWIKYSPSANEERLTTSLNLQSIPKSIEKLNCPPKDNMAEVVIQCTFTLEKTEFDSLLKGFEFKEASKDFFEVPHPPFAHGGDVTIKRTDLESTNRFYIEVNYFKK